MIFNVKSINTVYIAGKEVDGMKRPREALSRPEIRKSHSSSERQTGMQRTSKRRDISEPTRTNLLSSRSSRAGNGTNAPEH